MDTSRQADINSLKSILQSESIDTLSIDEICNFFRNETSISKYMPESIFQIDPRNGLLLIHKEVF